MLRETKWLTQDHTASEWAIKSELPAGLTDSKVSAPTTGQ